MNSGNRQSMNQTYPYDVIVVLGAAVWTGGNASPALMRRTMHAITAYQEGLAPYILGSGGLGKHPPSEATAIAEICQQHRIPQSALLSEGHSTSTIENAVFSAGILSEIGAKNLLIVTDRYHLPRTLMCFRALGFNCTGSGPDWQSSPMPMRHRAWALIHEAGALAWYAVRLKFHPDFRKPL